MTERELLRALRRGDTRAVEAAIDLCGAYVAAVIHNQLGRLSSPEDVEELSSDVFLALWQNREKLRGDSLRPWLGTVARNRARSHLRKLGELTVPEDELLTVATDCTETLASERERRRTLARAVSELGEPDGEIFVRRYYYNQSIPNIAAETGLHPENIKTRLRRGREKLKAILEKGGFEL